MFELSDSQAAEDDSSAAIFVLDMNRDEGPPYGHPPLCLRRFQTEEREWPA